MMPMPVMAASELFGLEHRPAEVDEQENGHDQRHDVVEHRLDLNSLAGFGDRPQHHKAEQRYSDVEKIKHGGALRRSSWLPTVGAVALGSHKAAIKTVRRVLSSPTGTRPTAR